MTPRTVLSLAECPIVYIHIITESANSDFCDLVHYHDSFAGITRVKTADGKTKLLGDVDFDNVAQKASIVTPVPGGVGPLTVAMVIRNTLYAAQKDFKFEFQTIYE